MKNKHMIRKFSALMSALLMLLSIPYLKSNAETSEIEDQIETDGQTDLATPSSADQVENQIELLASVVPSELELDDLLNYNVVVFGNFYGERADIEGSAAVQGNGIYSAKDWTFDIGGASLPGNNFMGYYDNPDGYPAFMSGGTVKREGGHFGVFGGPVILKKSFEPSYNYNTIDTNSDIFFTDDILVNEAFANMNQTVTETSEVFAEAYENSIMIEDLNFLRFLDMSEFEVNSFEDLDSVLIINIKSNSDVIKIGEVHFPEEFLDYDVIIINSNAKKVIFGGGAQFLEDMMIGAEYETASREKPGNQLLSSLAARIIWNFSKAEEVNMAQYAVVGSVIAPKAHLTGSGGSVNGMIAVKKLTQLNGMEEHAFSIKPIWRKNPVIRIPDLSLQIYKISAEKELALPDVKFKLIKYSANNDKWEKYAELTTLSTGYSNLVRLEEGKYQLTEESTADGYKLLKEPIKFSVDSAMMPELEAASDDILAELIDDDLITLQITIKNSLDPKVDKPDKPDKPENPDKPDNPDKPETPDKPRTSRPGKPSKPRGITPNPNTPPPVNDIPQVPEEPAIPNEVISINNNALDTMPRTGITYVFYVSLSAFITAGTYIAWYSLKHKKENI